MGQSLDQIGAAVPFRGFRGVGLIAPVAQEQQLPAGDHGALIERKRQLVRAGRRMNRRPRHQIRIERAVVFVGNMGEVVIREGRIEMLAIPIDARLHGAAERGFRPAADPGLGIGRDVRGIDRAERRRHRKPAGEILAVAHRMTVVAIADRGKITPTLDRARSNDCGAGGSMAAIAGRHTIAVTAIAAAIAAMATMLPIIRGDVFVIRAFS